MGDRPGGLLAIDRVIRNLPSFVEPHLDHLPVALREAGWKQRPDEVVVVVAGLSVHSAAESAKYGSWES